MQVVNLLSVDGLLVSCTEESFHVDEVCCMEGAHLLYHTLS